MISLPWRIAVVCEREWPRSQSVEHPENSETGPDGMTRLHSHHAADKTLGMSGDDVFKVKTEIRIQAIS